MRFTAMLAGALCITTVAAAPAFAQIAPKSESARIEIRFNPPLDMPQRFRLTRSKSRGDAPASTVSWIEELRFARNGDGFILYWHMVWESLPAAMRAPGVAALTLPFAQDPIAFDLDADGNVLRVRDWATVQPKLIGIVRNSGSLLGSTGADKATTDAVIAQMSARFQALNAETAPSVMLRNIDPALGGGGISARVGEKRTSSDDVAIPLFDTTIKRIATITMRSADAGSATIDMVSRTDPDSLRNLLSAIAGMTPEKRTQLDQAMASIQQLSVVDTSSTTIDRMTGLPTRLENRRVAKADGVDQTETLLIEWVR